METINYKSLFILLVALMLGVFQIQAQTYGYGAIGGTGCTATGTGGNCTDTYLGQQAGASNTGGQNTFLGDHAGYSNSTMKDNTAVGYKALYTQGYSNADNGYNVAVGSGALYYTNPTSSSNGFQNTALGYWSLYNNTTGYGNNANGYKSGYTNTTGTYNTFSGFQSGYSNSTGSQNTFVGLQAGYSNTTSYNTFIGSAAGYSNSSGGHGTMLGYTSGYKNTTGADNTFIGFQSGHENLTGQENVFVGLNAGYYNTSSDNTFLGYKASENNTSGNENVAIGTWAGSVNTTGSDNTFVGYGADAGANNYSNAMAIGSGAVVGNSNYIMIGNSSILRVGGYQNWYNYSDGRFKINVHESVKGLDFINKLRPVIYQLNTLALDSFIIQNMPDSVKAKHQAGVDFAASTAKVHSGFIAQEVEQAEHDCGFISSIVSTPANSADPYAISYAEIVVPLVKAVQELSKKLDSLMVLKSNEKSIINNNTGSIDPEKNIRDIKLSLPDAATLGDAQPNPNNVSTQISYFLPDNTSNAKIIFTDMLGKVIEEESLQTGYGLLNIDTQDIPSGTYFYSLVVNGKAIDSKKMIRNK